ncbi:multicopper oxidase domain-containing protein [Pseudonocardia thermophila]|uniref:multicopper oxidase domain-containing protein n=1 Tax=Pseudonocardia thermophila TaxID=1848 RepID=UPI0009FE5558
MCRAPRCCRGWSTRTSTSCSTRARTRRWPAATTTPCSPAAGARTDGTRYTLNGTTPGPDIRVAAGQLLQVRLVSESVADGVTLHGVDVPNAEDGVAGVTQDAEPPGGEHVYRFVAPAAGTYWCHSHQVSHEQVVRGLLGALVIERSGGTAATDVGLRRPVHARRDRRDRRRRPRPRPRRGRDRRFDRVVDRAPGSSTVWPRVLQRPPRRRARPRRRRRDRQPWWFDSLEVDAGQSYFAALRTDNPGVWLDHCHNLQHACDGRWTT